MRTLVAMLTASLLAFALGLYLPWWSVAVATFVVGLFATQRPRTAFFSGFAAIFLLWAGLCVMINGANGGILAARVSEILPLGGSVFLLIFATAFTGGLVGGLASLTAGLLRLISSHERTA